MTGWNEYYAKSKRKYADTLSAQRKVPNPSKLVKQKVVDDDKIWDSK